MSNTVLQNPTVAIFGGATTATKTFSSSCTSGTKIIAAVSQETRAATIAVTDNGNAGNYAVDKEQANSFDAGGGGKVGIYSMANSASTAVTVTATLSSATNFGHLKIIELSGASGVDATAGATSTGTGMPSISIATTTANCTVMMICAEFPAVSGNSGTADTGYTATLDTTGNQGYHSVEHNADVGAAATKTLTWGTPTPGGNYAFTMAAVAYATVSNPALDEDGEWIIVTQSW